MHGKPEWATLGIGAILDDGTEYQRHDGGQLDQDVEGGTGGILEGIADCITGDSVLVRGGALSEFGTEAA